jgi:hypothetical protein
MWFITSLKWLWGIIKLPITIDECVKLLKEVNEKIDSPSRYNQELLFYKETYALRIEELKKEASTSDSQRKAQIEGLIKQLEQANEVIRIAGESMRKIAEERNLLREGFQESEELIKLLNKELEKQKLKPMPTLADLALKHLTGIDLENLDISQKNKKSPNWLYNILK